METSNDKPIACAQTSEERDAFLDTLPKLSSTEVPSGDCCPICLIPFFTILEEEREEESTADPSKERLGVTRLRCGHIFCFSDIAVWIHTSRGSCPTCRDLFLIIPEPAEDESSDGGEYIPGSDSVADDMMDWETWTDEEGEIWTDGEDISLDEGITEGETDSSWERSSEGNVLDEADISAPGEVGQPLAVIASAGDRTSLTVPHDPECEQIQTELTQWRARIERIQVQEHSSNQQEAISRIREGVCALGALKPRIDSLERDTSAKISFVFSALSAMQEISSLMEHKLEMMDNDGFTISQGDAS